MDPKQLTCLDEEQLVEITRTYVLTDLPLVVGDNGSQEEELSYLNQ